MSCEKVSIFFPNLFETGMGDNGNRTYRFKSFLLNVEERQLFDGDSEIPLTPKAFDVLVHLVENAGHLVHKDDLMKAVWPDSFVEEVNIPRSVHHLRKTLGQDDNGNKFIETVPTKGYRFVAEVTSEVEAAPSAHENGNDPPPELWPDQLEIPKTDTSQASEQQISNRVVLISLAALVATSVLFFAFTWNPGSPAANGGQISLAVLPPRPVDAGNRDAIYEIGIADSLIVHLGRSSQSITVRPLSAVRKYLDVEQDVLAAGTEQKVDFVLASTYTVANGRVRVSSQLMNVRTGSIEDSFVFDEGNADVLAATDTITSNIGRRLLAKLNIESDGSAAKKGTTNSEAYRLYLQGMNLVNRRGGENHAKAAEHFEKATALDPNYALAWFGLGYARLGISMPGGDKLEERKKARDAAQKALALDPGLAEAYSLLAEITCLYEWDHTEADRLNRRALELDPKSSHANRTHALQLTHMKRFDEAIAHINTAIDLDPHSAFDQLVLGMILYHARRYDEAIVQLERVRETFPDHVRTPAWLMQSYVQKGDFQKAFDNFLLTPVGKNADAETKASWQRAFKEHGWLGVQRLRLEAAVEEEKKESFAGGFAATAASLGQTDLAIAHLEEACDKRVWSVVIMNVNPALDPLNSDPRFQALLRRVNLN